MIRRHQVFTGLFAVLVMVGTVFAYGCGGENTTPVFDVVEDEGPVDIVDKSQSIVFATPEPGARRVVSGTYKVSFTYSDALGLPASLTISFVRASDVEPLVIEAPTPGNYEVDLDTTLAGDGADSIQVVATASDDRSVTARAKVTVDNTPPIVSILEPTPADQSNFIEDLKVRVKVTDDGNKVRNVRVTVGDFEWKWPQNEGDSSDVVDTRVTVTGEDGETYEDLVVPTTGWQGGPVQMTVTADDGVEGHQVEVVQDFTFVEVPGFVGGEGLPLTGVGVVDEIHGIRIGPADDGIWAVGYVAPGGIGLTSRVSRGVLDFLPIPEAAGCTDFIVRDLDRDGYDDILAFCRDEIEKHFRLLRQTETLEFELMEQIPYECDIVKITSGSLNYDDFPDIAFTSTDQTNSVGIINSTVDEYGDLTGWGQVAVYSGAVSPQDVAIGLYASNSRNAVVVSSPNSGIVTVFPVNQDGIATSGENSTLDPQDGLVKGVTSMVSVNFDQMDDDGNTLLYTDMDGEDTLGLARMNTVSYRVQKLTFWQAGVDPKDIALGDIDGNRVIDAVVLCTGANMVQVFMGVLRGEETGEGAGSLNYLRDGLALFSGAARDVTLADMDNDGTSDIVLLDRDGTGLVVIYYRKTEQGNRFIGSYQAVLDSSPISLQLGHFTAPLQGAGAAYLDAAVLLPPNVGKPRVMVYSSDSVVGMPVTYAGSTQVDLGQPKKLIAGNFDVLLSQSATDPYKRPDDIVVTSSDASTGDDDHTAYLLLMHEVSHASMSASPMGLAFGNSPAVMTAADFDRDSISGSSYTIMDLGYVSRVDAVGESPGKWLLHSMIGNMDGTFDPMTIYDEPIAPIQIPDDRDPVAIKAFPMRRTLVNYANGKAGDVDLILANSGTGDLTVFLNKGVGIFQPKDEGSRDFAIGGTPIDLAAGYLRSKVDGTADAATASNEFPDIAVLLDDRIVILYSLDKDGAASIGEDVAFDPPVSYEFPGKAPNDIALADMNGDAYMDIVVLDRDSSMVWIYVNLANRRFSSPYAFDTGTMPVEMVVADVDADGCIDIVTADANGKTLTSLRNTTAACMD